MSSLRDICSVLRDRLLIDLQPGGAAAAWMALKPQLKYAVGLQGAMDSTACTGTSNAWGKRHAVLTNRKNMKPYHAFKRLEEQVHSQLIGAAAAGCGSSAADTFVAVPMQPDQSLKNYLIATARRNDPHYVHQMVHKAHASATEKKNAKIIKGLKEVVQALKAKVAELEKDNADEIGEMQELVKRAQAAAEAAASSSSARTSRARPRNTPPFRRLLRSANCTYSESIERTASIFCVRRRVSGVSHEIWWLQRHGAPAAARKAGFSAWARTHCGHCLTHRPN